MNANNERLDRLRADQNEIGRGNALMKIRFGRNAESLVRLGTYVGVLVAGPDAILGDDAAGDQPADEGLPHNAGADHTERQSIGDHNSPVG